MKKLTAVVTGGSRGIGAGIVECLANEGWNVAFCDIHPVEDMQAQVAELNAKYNSNCQYFKCDISNSEDRKNLIADVVATYGELNALVNNAGVAPLVRADILEMTEESYDRVMNINLKSTIFLSQIFGNYIAENKVKATIVNIGSCSATVASISRGEYCISKAGTAMLTKLLAVRMAEYDVPVYELRPGVIMTNMTGVVKDKYDKLIAEGLTLQPRWGQPSDLGKAVAMLLRGDLAYSTGQVIDVDGGMGIARL